MRVCLLARKVKENPEGGYERYSLDVYKGLVERDIQIELLSQNCSIPPFRSLISPLFYDVLSVPAGLLLTKLRGRQRIDVYHATIPTQGLYFPLIPRRNTVVTFFDAEGISSMKAVLSGATILRKMWNIYARSATILALKYAGHIIAASEQAKEEVITLAKVAPEKITVILPNIDERFEPLEGYRKEVPTVGYLGNLIPRKGVDYLLRAFYLLRQKYPNFNCRLKICGAGPEYKNLTALAKQLNLNNVDFEGLIPEEKIVETYNSFDLFAFPSKYEGFGLPILEAQRCGIPVLIRKDGKIPNEVKRFALECSSEQDMADKIYSLLTDHNLYLEISEKGMNYAKQFTRDKSIEEILRVYEKVAGS